MLTVDTSVQMLKPGGLECGDREVVIRDSIGARVTLRFKEVRQCCEEFGYVVAAMSDDRYACTKCGTFTNPLETRYEQRDRRMRWVRSLASATITDVTIDASNDFFRVCGLIPFACACTRQIQDAIDQRGKSTLNAVCTIQLKDETRGSALAPIVLLFVNSHNGYYAHPIDVTWDRVNFQCTEEHEEPDDCLDFQHATKTFDTIWI